MGSLDAVRAGAYWLCAPPTMICVAVAAPAAPLDAVSQIRTLGTWPDGRGLLLASAKPLTGATAYWLLLFLGL